MSSRVQVSRLRAAVLPAAALCAVLLPPHGSPVLEPLAVPFVVRAAVIAPVAAAAAWAVPRRPWPLLLVAVADALVWSPGFLLSLASYVAAVACRRSRHVAAYAAVAALTAVVPRPGAEISSSLGAVPLFVGLPLAAGLWVTARRQAMAALRERAERVEREQEARAGRVRAQERARIARDMHDVVAHRISLVVLRAGALEINAPDERTAAEAELIRATGKEALAELRAVLGVLGQDDGDAFHPQPLLADLDRLLDHSRSAGVPVERRDEGTAGAPPVMVQHTVYRVVQEALTNVHKHAGPAATTVVLRHLPGALEVTVRNAAPGCAPPAVPGGGTGLIGLRERVELLGGEFAAGPEPDGGFVVRARLCT
ncbi:histidine kinase [Sphaerisporangium sp. B11E5]|uniref:sensor histidine kinase n=1 Tax=Sphaerisporangium sp. B11E5 TaxID=3153563 RepID=UPI00325D1FB7